MPWPELWGRFRIMAESKGEGGPLMQHHESEQRWRAAKQRTSQMNPTRQRGAH